MEDFFAEIIVVSLAAVTLVPILYRLGLGVIIAYILAGFIVGPEGLGFINDLPSIEKASELGVIFLLFIIGLSLTPAKLKNVTFHIGVTGPLQMFASSAIITGFCHFALKIPLAPSLAMGLALGLSSTAFGLRYLQDHPDPQKTDSNAVTGVLIFQDLCVAPILIALGLLSEAKTSIPWTFVLLFFTLIAFYAVAADRIFKVLIYRKYPEIFTAACILVVIAASVLSKKAFGTTSIGALGAGIVLAQSTFVDRIQYSISPFKGLLLGLFFMSIGMGLGQSAEISKLPIILGLAVLLVIVKLIVATTAFYTVRRPLASSLYSGAIISQAGEFGFIIVIAGREAGLFAGDIPSLMSAVIAFTLIIPPIVLPILGPNLRRRIK